MKKIIFSHQSSPIGKLFVLFAVCFFSSLLCLAIGIILLNEPHQLKIKLENQHISVIYDDLTVIDSKLPETYQPAHDQVTFQVTHNRDFFLLPKKFRHTSVEISSESTAESTSNLPFKPLPSYQYTHPLLIFIDPNLPIFSGAGDFNDVSGFSQYFSDENYDSFELIARVKNPEIIEMQFGDLGLWMRTKWHHESLVITPSGNIIGNSAGLSLLSMVRSFLGTLLLILFSTGIFIAITLLLALICFALKPLFIFELNIPHVPQKYLEIFAVSLVVLIFFGVSCFIATNIFEKTPHSQDEVAYLFQAKMFANRKLFGESLGENIRHFFDHEFITNDGKWFGIFPPGNSIALAVGILIGAPWLINPIIGAFNIVLLYMLVKAIYSKKEALISIILYTISPMYLLMSGSYMSHPLTLSLLLSSSLLLINNRMTLGGIAIGGMILTRPLTGVVYFCMVALFLLAKNKYQFRTTLTEIRDILYGITPMLLLLFTYNLKLTGNPLTMPYVYYSPFNRLGFGPRGLEFALDFTFPMGVENALFNLQSALHMFFPFTFYFGLSLIPLGFIDREKRKKSLAWLLLAIAVAIAHIFYFNKGTFLGPRFWYELGIGFIVVAAVGLVSLYSVLNTYLKSNVFPFIIISGVTIGLIYFNQFTFNHFIGYNGMRAAQVDLEVETPSVVTINHADSWQAYGKYFWQMDPSNLETNQTIYIRSRTLPIFVPQDEEKTVTVGELEDWFPQRTYFSLENGILNEL